MSDRYLRVYLTDGDTIDLVSQASIETWQQALSVKDVIAHRHVGGNECAIPVRSILWAEIIEPEPDA